MDLSHSQRMVSKISLAVLVLVSLSCGGSPATPNQTTSSTLAIPEGVWKGTINSVRASQVIQATAIVLPTGEARYTGSTGIQIAATISGNTATGTMFAPLGAVLLDGSVVAPATISLSTVSPKNVCTGSYSGGGDQGTFALSYQSSYEHSASLPKLSNTWSSIQTSSGLITALQGRTDGSFTGSDAYGTIQGQATIADPTKNAYRLTLAYKLYSGEIWNMSGLATLQDGPNGPDTQLLVQVSNAVHAFSGSFNSTNSGVPHPVISSFTAANNSLSSGAATTLTAEFANGTGVVDHGLGAVQSAIPIETGPLTATKTYTLTVTNSLGEQATASVTVTVAAPSTVRVSVLGQFEKPALTATGFGSTTILPIRHSYTEVRQVGGNTLLASGYLGPDGTAYVDVPTGTQLYATVYTDFEAPSGSGTNDFFMQGGVINQPFNTTAGFTVNDEWFVTSDTVTANTSGTLTVTATTASRIAGAFNINDQMLTQGLALKALEPTLRLPSLFTYWSTNTNPAHQQRGYPYVLKNGSQVVKSTSGRAIFTQSLNGLLAGGPNTETDEWDDGVIQEVSAHMLFADYSSKADGSSSFSLLRRDNDNTYVSRYSQSESTVGFVGGFCDFLAGALRNNPIQLDSYTDSAGAPRVDVFDLSRRLLNQVDYAEPSEFTRGSVATSLWGIWKNSLPFENPSDNAALATLWQAVRSNTQLSDGTGEFNNATLACYPSYLLGVKSRVGPTTWNSVVTQLGTEFISEPNALYFSSNSLWFSRSVPFFESDVLKTYAPSSGIYYDRNQSQAWRFTQSYAGSRTITMTPTGGQDLWVEVIGPGGVWAESIGGAGGTRSFNTGTLPVGVYAVRVRAGNTTATGSFGYTLSVN